MRFSPPLPSPPLQLAEEKLSLTAKMESLQADVDFTQKQLNAAKGRRGHVHLLACVIT